MLPEARRLLLIQYLPHKDQMTPDTSPYFSIDWFDNSNLVSALVIDDQR